MTDKPLILVADDETRIRRLVVESLENAGFDVCQAQDGRQAVDVFRLSPVEPDLVILDLMMPEMDGEEALKVIRKTSARPEIFSVTRASASMREQMTISSSRFPFRSSNCV